MLSRVGLDRQARVAGPGYVASSGPASQQGPTRGLGPVGGCTPAAGGCMPAGACQQVAACMPGCCWHVLWCVLSSRQSYVDVLLPRHRPVSCVMSYTACLMCLSYVVSYGPICPIFVSYTVLYCLMSVVLCRCHKTCSVTGRHQLVLCSCLTVSYV